VHQVRAMKERIKDIARSRWALGARFVKALVIAIALLSLEAPSSSFAARPLATDDPSTVGKSNYMIESGAEASSRSEIVEGVRTRETETEASTTFTYGVLKNLDLVAGSNYEWEKSRTGGITTVEANGLTDASVQAKWRFYDRDGLSLGLKPGITVPTGNDRDGLGAGKMTYGMIFMASRTVAPFAIYANVGYYRNENNADQRRDIWQASLAGSVEPLKGLNLVSEIWIQSNSDSTVRTPPAYVLGGLCYSITDWASLDGAVKMGLNRQEVDRSYILGVTLNF
jgi:hypothetical protein